MTALTLRDVEVGGRGGLDVRIEAGRIVAIGPGLPRDGDALDGCGGALIPGLCDHHIHLLGLAAQLQSVVLDDVTSLAGFTERIAAAAARTAAGDWIRAGGYHEAGLGELTREVLDRVAPNHPLRVQHRTGALWVLNSRALAALGEGDDPPGLDRAQGRLWRSDVWLRARIGAEPPPLAPVGAMLARFGLTHVTDASITTDPETAGLLAAAHRRGDLPQRLTLMSGGLLEAPADGAFAVGPCKVLLDDHALPDLEDFTWRIGAARRQGRSVAVHCVTAGELALTMAAFEAAGSRPGDRVEHGGVIPAAATWSLKALGLTVVTQPAFIRERGDRYAREVDPADLGDLYRCASLIVAGVPVGGSSDAPYASPDPWVGVAAAMDRRARSGAVLGSREAVGAELALGLYLGAPDTPGGPARQLAVGAPADLCLLERPLCDVLAAPSSDWVRATLVGGRIAYRSD